MTDFSTALTVVKAALAALYYLLAASAGLQLIRIHMAQTIKKLTVQKIFHVMLFCGGIVRGVLFSIPASTYELIAEHTPLQVLLDLAPELIFFFTYFLLILFWGVVFQYSKGIDSRPLLYRNIWICFGLVALTVSGVAIAIAVLLNYLPSVDIGYTEAGFLAVLSLTLSFLIAVYTIYLNVTLKRAESIRLALFKKLNKSKRRRKASTSQENPDIISFPSLPRITNSAGSQPLRLVGIACIICFFLHAAYVVVLDVSAFNRDIEPRWVYLIIWFFYFVITEALPAFLVLYIMSDLPPPELVRPGQGGHKKENINSNNDDEEEPFLGGFNATNNNAAMLLPVQHVHPLYSNLWAIPKAGTLFEDGVTGYAYSPTDSDCSSDDGRETSYVEVYVEASGSSGESEGIKRSHSMVVECHQIDLKG